MGIVDKTGTGDCGDISNVILHTPDPKLAPASIKEIRKGVYAERSQEDYRRLMRTSNVIGVAGIAASAGSFVWMISQVAKVDLSTPELVAGTVAVAAGVKLMNLAGAFHDAAGYSNGPKSSVMENFKTGCLKNKLAWAVTAGVSLAAGSIVNISHNETQADQVRLKMLPHIDPNTVVRQVTAQEEHCAGERAGKVVTLDYRGRQFVFQCQ